MEKNLEKPRNNVRVINNIKIPKFLLVNLIKHKKQNFNFKESIPIRPKNNNSLFFIIFNILTGRNLPILRRYKQKKKYQDLITKKFLYYLNINKYSTTQSQFTTPLYGQMQSRRDSLLGGVLSGGGIFKNEKKISRPARPTLDPKWDLASGPKGKNLKVKKK